MPNIKQVQAPRTKQRLRGASVRSGTFLQRLAARNAAVAWGLQRLYDAYPDAAPFANLRPQNVAAANQLGSVANGLSGIAQTMDAVHQTLPRKERTFNWVVDTMQENLCNKCACRAACWSAHYGELMDAFYDIKPILEQTEHVGVEQFTAGLSHCVHPAAMASELTRAYALYRGQGQAKMQSDALRSALTEQYGAVAQALESLSAQLSVQGMPEHYKTRRVMELFAELGMPLSECAVTQEANGSLRAVVTLPRSGFTAGELESLARDLTRVCHRTIAMPQKLSCRGVSTLIFHEIPALRPVFGVAFQPAKGDVSGDAVQQFCREHTAEMILCDGMGTGRPAAVDGNLAAELTARLLKAGFTAQTAARLVNIALSLKSEEESCATLDLVSVDLYTGVANLFKAGAAPGFVVQGGKAYTMGATSLPVGILGEVKGAQTSLHLQVGDVAVLVSDGVLQQGEGWVAQMLSQSVAMGHSPQRIAEQLVKTARAHAVTGGAAHPDDMTAAVLQLVRN
ncbi:MAG: PP2C family protein-serine/threonine phosphatase [Faecalibacterium sp.]